MSPCLDLGGFTLALAGPGMEILPHRLCPFRIPDRPAEISCEGEIGPPEAPGDLLVDSPGVWRLARSARRRDGLCLQLRAGGPGGQTYQSLELTPDLSRGRARLDPRLLRDPEAGFPLREPLLELWLSCLLFAGRGLLLHACGLLAAGGVHAFVGPSGAGKSTLAGLLARAGAGALLSDDRLIVRADGEGFRAWGSPWHGTAGCASSASGALRAVYVLEQSLRPERVPLGPGEAAMHLAANCFRAAWPPDGALHLLEGCARLAERLPCYRLRFPADASALEALDLG